MQNRHAGRIAGVAVLAIPFLPKCPVCALPFLAAAGIALPHGPAVEAVVAAAVAGWLAVVVAAARWFPVRAGAVIGAGALLLGRFVDVAALTLSGSVLMFAVAIWIAARPRRCHAEGPLTTRA